MPYNLTEQPEINDEIEVPEGSDIVSRPALISVFQRLANRTRNLMDRLGGRTGSGEWLYLDEAGDPDPKSRTVFIDAFRARVHGWGNSSALLNGYLQAGSDSELAFLPLSWLPDGAVITSARVLVNQAASFAIGANIFSHTVSGTTYSSRTSIAAGDSSGTGDQWITLTPGSPPTVSKAGQEALYILVASAQSGDRIYGFEISFTDPGPRNF